MIINIITLACLALLVLEVIIMIANVLNKNRQERIEFLRGFKNGKCAVIYVSAIPLYCLGHLYAGDDFLKSVFSSISEIINLVVLNYDVSSIEGLMQDNLFYETTVYICFLLVGFNAMLFLFSLTNQHIWEYYQSVKSFIAKKNKLFIFGYNSKNKAIYKSDSKRYKTIIDKLSTEARYDMYLNKVAYINTEHYEKIVDKIFKALSRKDFECVVVVNTGKDDENIYVCRMFVDRIRLLEKQRQEELFAYLKVFVFGDPRYSAIYEDAVSSAYGCIHYVNEYQKIAMDFIDKYPLTKFMDEAQIDYKTSLIKENVDINMLLVGFGKTNRQIFMTSVANNQFLQQTENGPRLKQVKYHIFDKDFSEKNKNLNHSYYRYKNECSSLNEDEYLPLPSLPAEESYLHLDINDKEFYNNIKKIITRSKDDVNYIVISFASDLENIDMAQKLLEKRREWEVENLTVFVKARTWLKEETMLEEDCCHFIGNEEEVICNIEKIIADKFFRMAQMRNEIYDLEYAIASSEGETQIDDAFVEANKKNADKAWYVTKSQMERESSLYVCLSVRSKLHLMGLDYTEKENEGEALTEDEYIELYAGEDKPITDKYPAVNGKRVVSYSIDFAESRRKNMAIHEHQRWNSFMISKGMIPSDKEQIRNERLIDKNGNEKYTNGKNYRVRRHGNLTTFDGLVEFRKIVAQRDGVGEEQRDVIKYDYQLLDDAFWLLDANGYKIIRK